MVPPAPREIPRRACTLRMRYTRVSRRDRARRTRRSVWYIDFGRIKFYEPYVDWYTCRAGLT